jgi:flagellar biosynthesis chaperone FliJ
MEIDSKKERELTKRIKECMHECEMIAHDLSYILKDINMRSK